MKQKNKHHIHVLYKGHFYVIYHDTEFMSLSALYDCIRQIKEASNAN